jgi:outer membrane protein OmpA-like peptidoglycan-associated protein
LDAAPDLTATDGAAADLFARDAAPPTAVETPVTPSGPLSIPGHPELFLKAGSLEAELLAFLKGAEPTPKTFTMRRLRYPTDSHEMNDEGQEETYLLGLLLLAFPQAQLEIHGHIDRSESEQYSGPKPFAGYTLSQLRADCVYRRVIHQGVAAGRLRIFGHGATRPLTDGQTAEDRQRNRRVEIVVLRR